MGLSPFLHAGILACSFGFAWWHMVACVALLLCFVCYVVDDMIAPRPHVLSWLHVSALVFLCFVLALLFVCFVFCLLAAWLAVPFLLDGMDACWLHPHSASNSVCLLWYNVCVCVHAVHVGACLSVCLSV